MAFEDDGIDEGIEDVSMATVSCDADSVPDSTKHYNAPPSLVGELQDKLEEMLDECMTLFEAVSWSSTCACMYVFTLD